MVTYGDGGMQQPEDSAPWWCDAEKDAWYDFEVEHPVEAQAISKLSMSIHFSSTNTSDPVLTSGVQVEGLDLRIAELLGMVSVERTS